MMILNSTVLKERSNQFFIGKKLLIIFTSFTQPQSYKHIFFKQNNICLPGKRFSITPLRSLSTIMAISVLTTGKPFEARGAHLIDFLLNKTILK